MKDLWEFLKSLGRIGEALSIWADPKRREVVKLKLAIEAAENLFDIEERNGIYASMKDKEIKKYITHWKKRWKAFKDGL